MGLLLADELWTYSYELLFSNLSIVWSDLPSMQQYIICTFYVADDSDDAENCDCVGMTWNLHRANFKFQVYVGISSHSDKFDVSGIISVNYINNSRENFLIYYNQISILLIKLMPRKDIIFICDEDPTWNIKILNFQVTTINYTNKDMNLK